ncbi:MAG TPA: hypothetical protein ENI07_13520 [Desulfobacterales bacterium]|nr:hypothetical protein [Desulfobacterales bacterium]
MTQSEFNKKWKPHQADYTYPVENLENERFESDLDELLKERACEFLDYMSEVHEMDKETGESLSKENKRLYDEFFNQPE